MLTDQQREGLWQWYSRDEVLDEARRLAEAKAYDELEDYLHRTCLFPLAKHDELPDYLRGDDGKPLFPKNLNPRLDEETWQDAVEIAWAVMRDQIGLSHDDVHRAIAAEQQDDWQAFLDSVERRKRERGE